MTEEGDGAQAIENLSDKTDEANPCDAPSDASPTQ